MLWIGFVLTLPLTGCQDPTAPCDRPNACEVSGVDLYISHLEIVANRFDSIDGLGIVDPDPLIVEVTVQNRGDSISAPATLVVHYLYAESDSLLIPPLGPGYSQFFRDTIATWEPSGSFRHVEGGTSPISGDTSSATAQVLIADSDTTNNRRVSAIVHVAVPLIEASIELQASDVWVNVPFQAHVAVNNISRYAALDGRAFGFHLFIMPAGDIPGWVGFGARDLPPLPPGDGYTIDELTVTLAAAWQHEAKKYRIVPVLAPIGTRDSTLLWDGRRLRWGVSDTVTIHPDYHACQPTQLRPDTLVWAPVVCTSPSGFGLFMLDARPDRLYAIEQATYPGAGVYNDAGERLGSVSPGQWFYFTIPGTKWLVDFRGDKSEVARAITLREKALNGIGEDR